MRAMVLCLAATVGIGSAAASAAISDPGLTGTVRTDQWDFTDVSNTLPSGTPAGTPLPYGKGNDPSAWPEQISSNVAGVDAEFTKTSGYGYISNGKGIYSLIYSAVVPNDAGGNFVASETNALSGLETIVFQLDISEAVGYDLHNNALPTLSYTTSGGTTSNVQPDAAGFLARDVIDYYTPQDPNIPEGQPLPSYPIYRNSRIMQWDLTGLGPISSFAISFESVAHSWIYGARLDQSNTYTAVPVPEPATLGLLSLSGLLLVRRKHA